MFHRPVAIIAVLLALGACGGSASSDSSSCPTIEDGVVMPEGEVTCVVANGQRVLTAAMWNECPNGDRVYRLNTSGAQGWWLSTDRIFHLEPLNGPAEMAACDSATV